MPVKYWDVRNQSWIKDKGLYIIGVPKLAKNGNLYKVGYSGSSLKNRLGNIREILSPAFQEPLMIYGVIVPKPGRSGVAQNVRAKELNEIEKLIHKWAQQDGMRETFVDSHKYSEWLRIADMSDLFEFIEDLINDHSSTYKIHFELKRL